MLDGWVPFPEEHRGDGSFVTQVSQPSDDNQYLTRFDHNITDRNKINFRLFYDHNEGADPLRNADFINYGPNPRFNRMQTYTLEDTHLITPTLVNTIRLTYTRFNYQESIPFDDDLADFGATHFNHAGGVVKSRPLVQITNRFRLGPGRHRQRLSQNYALSWNMSLLKGNHNMKWGLDTQRNQFLYRDNRATGSEWQFTGNRTGLPMADFVTGKARRVRQASPIEFDHRYIQSGIFFSGQLQGPPQYHDDFGRAERVLPALGRAAEPADRPSARGPVLVHRRRPRGLALAFGRRLPVPRRAAQHRAAVRHRRGTCS